MKKTQCLMPGLRTVSLIATIATGSYVMHSAIVNCMTKHKDRGTVGTMPLRNEKS